jgi:hypothetical protein
MNKYTFNWSIAPASPVEYSLAVTPFDVVVREGSLTLTTSAEAADEQKLQAEADRVVHDLARSLSFEHGERFEVAPGCYSVLTPEGGQRVCTSGAISGKATVSGTLEFEVRDAAGNVVDSSALRCERERQAAQERVADRAKRAALDPNLRDMLDHWRRYTGDPDGHPLYDVLQVVERLHAGKEARRMAAAALNMKEEDFGELARISNDPTVLNGRHPGKWPGPHRIASETEVNTCERVARAIIEKYASKIVG